MISLKKRITWGLITILLVTLFPGSVMAEVEKADTVYLGGNIYTVDEEFSKASAMAVKGEYILYVGNDEEAKSYIGADTEIVELQGKTVIPGLIEGHMHFPGEGEKLLQIDAFWKPKEEILAAVKAEADRLTDGEWIVGRGWNQEVWIGEEFPTKEELDEVAPNNPVALTRTCGHATWVNSMALKIAGITQDTPNPQGGEILRSANGEATGILTDTAASAVRSKIPEYSVERKKEALLKAQEELFSYGLTSATDAGSGVLEIQNMKELYESGDLKIRLYTMVSSGEDAKAYYEKGPEIGLYDNRLTVKAIKFYADGSLGARSAWMLEEYSDRPEHLGNGRYENEDFYEMVREARENGFQVATHAIGDAAVRQCVDTYEKVLKENPLEDHRYRIEHFQIATLEDIQRITNLGIVPAMQAAHATSDKNMAEERVGSERIKGAYAWRKVIDAGSVIPNGSDAPVELVNPYHGLFAAVTRMDREGEPPEGWYPEECMTREEALKSFTIWAAYGQFEETLKGSLEVGKLADFVVIDRDYMTCPDMDIKDINPLMTVVGGEVVYHRNVSNHIDVLFKGKTLGFDKGIMISKGRTLVPAQELLHAMDLEYDYYGADGIIIISDKTTSLELRIDDINAIKDGSITSCEVGPRMMDKVLFIPLRFILENFDYKVMWYGDSRTISINK